MKKIQFLVFLCFMAASNFIAAQGLIIDKAAIDALPAYPEPRGNGGKAGVKVFAKTLERYVGSALNQGETYSCASQAVVKAYQIQVAQDNKWSDPKMIDQNAFNAFSLYNYMNKKSCKAATPLDEVFKIAETKGMCPEKVFAATSCTELPPAQAQNEALKNRVAKTLTLFETESNDANFKISRIKQAIVEDLPVVVGVEIDSAFAALKNNGGKYWRPMAGHSDYPLHALLVIGFDDYRDGGCFQLLNSWGSSWGNNGMCYVRYNDFIAHCQCATVPSKGNINLPAPSTTPTTIPSLPVSNYTMQGNLQFLHYDSWDEKNDKAIFKSAPVRFVNQGAYFETQEVWGVGQQFQISAMNAQKGMSMYVFSIDPKGKTELHYPTQKEIKSQNLYGASTMIIRRQSPYMPSDSIQLLLPSQNEALVLDHAGQDNICVLFASQEITDIDAILAQLNADIGAIEQRLQKALGNRLIPAADIKYTDGKEVSFATKSTKGSIVPLILKVSAK